MQVSYLKMSPYFFHPISTYFPLPKSKFLSSCHPQHFCLQHLPPHMSPVAGSKANSDTYLPLEKPVPALPQVVQTPWENKVGKGLPCVIQLMVIVHRYCVFCSQTNTHYLGGQWICVQLTCVYGQLRTASTNLDCKGTTEIQYIIFCIKRGNFRFPWQRRLPIWHMYALLLLLRLENRSNWGRGFSLAHTHTRANTQNTQTHHCSSSSGIRMELQLKISNTSQPVV